MVDIGKYTVAALSKILLTLQRILYNYSAYNVIMRKVFWIIHEIGVLGGNFSA
jgi:hypothetical protein